MAQPHPNAQLITRFYDAFARRDGDAMAACYHVEARFSDPVFPELRGPEPGLMWQMLCSRAADLKIEASRIQADHAAGSAHWEAWYTFGQTGRAVHNRIDAKFEFRDGLFVRHEDRFDFHAWAKQALGPMGWVLGWTGALQRKVQEQAAKGLAQYRAKRQS